MNFVCRVSGTILLAIAPICVVFGSYAFAQSNTGPSPVDVGGVFKGSFSDVQSFVGTVEPVRQVVVGSAVDGRVKNVRVDRGQEVQFDRKSAESLTLASEILVELDTTTLLIEIESAKIQLQLTEQALGELQTSLPIDVDLAKAKVAEADAKKEFSQNEFSRLNRLAAQSNAISPSELEQARSQFRTDEQLATQAKSELQRLELTRQVRIDQMSKRVEAALQSLLLLQDQESKFTIRAPFHGYVVNKLTEVGAWISRGDPLVEIVELDEVDFSINLPQELLGRLQQLMESSPNKVTLAVQFEGIETPITATLIAIVPQVDMRTRLATIRARMTNPIVGGVPLLKPGMLGRAHLAVGSNRDMILLSRDALVLGGTQPVVYKIIKRETGTTVVPVLVELGVNFGDWIEVKGEVADGDQVVVVGNERLRPNAEVKIIETRNDRPKQ